MACGCATARRNGFAAASSSTNIRRRSERLKPIAGPGEGKRDTSVNTNLTVVGGKLCAVVEAGNLPVELDYELESVRRTDFDGTLEAGFTGHPKYDPVTGEQHALAYEPFQPVRYISVGRDGRATTKARIDLPHIPMIHDMAFTPSFIIVPDFPVTFQPERAHTQFPWLWDERRPSRIGLLPRDGDVSRLQWFETPRCFAFHFANAYDDGDLTIIDLPKHPSMFRTDQNGPDEGAPILVRWTLNRATGHLTETVLDDRGNDFPRINGRYGGQDYRYIYTAHWGDRVEVRPRHEARPATRHDRGARLWPRAHDVGARVRAQAGRRRRRRRLDHVLRLRLRTPSQRRRHPRGAGLRGRADRHDPSSRPRAVHFSRRLGARSGRFSVSRLTALPMRKAHGVVTKPNRSNGMRTGGMA